MAVVGARFVGGVCVDRLRRCVPRPGSATAPPGRAQWLRSLTGRARGEVATLRAEGARHNVLCEALPVLAASSSRRPRLALANGLLLLGHSRTCADFRPCLEGGPLPGGTYHPLAVRPASGYPSLASLPHGPAISEVLAAPGVGTIAPKRRHNDCPISHPAGAQAPGGPRGGSRGGRKKWPKLSRLGELLNTQKNVHFFAPPGGGAPGGSRGGSKMAPSGTPFLGGLIIQIKAKRAPKRAHFWALRRGLREPPGGAPGAPRAPGPGGAPGAPAPARAPARGRPPGGVPEGGPGGGLRQGSQTGVSATCNDCPV